jgi:hypothetical protein
MRREQAQMRGERAEVERHLTGIAAVEMDRLVGGMPRQRPDIRQIVPVRAQLSEEGGDKRRHIHRPAPLSRPEAPPGTSRCPGTGRRPRRGS